MKQQSKPVFTQNSEPETKRSSRPLRKVLDFLEGEIEHAGKASRRLPTIRDVSLRLQVSPRTVQKAFHQLAAKGRIKSVTGRGSFTVPQSKESERQFLFALNIELDHRNVINAWAYTIYGAILQAALTSGRNARFTTVEETLANPGTSHVDGFILLPDATEIRERLRREQPHAPAVFLNPPAGAATANFVSPDYNQVGSTLGNCWKQCGKRRIVFMHHPSLISSASGQLVVSGLVSALGKAHNELEYLRMLEAVNFTEDAGYEAMRDFLRQEPARPDAVFCKGDFLALGAIQALREAGCEVPREVSVVGGSGLDLSETERPQLTRCRQPFQQLGEALVSMLLTRIEQSGASHPGLYLPAPFIGGATTTEAENEIFFQTKNPPAMPIAVPAAGS